MRQMDGQATQSFCSPKLPLLNTKQFTPYPVPHHVRTVARPRPAAFLPHCVKVLLSNRAGVPERLLHLWPCDQDSPVHMQIHVCSSLNPSPGPLPCLCCPGTAFLEAPASDISDFYVISLLGHKGYSLFLLEADQSRCWVPVWVLSFSCVN